MSNLWVVSKLHLEAVILFQANLFILNSLEHLLPERNYSGFVEKDGRNKKLSHEDDKQPTTVNELENLFNSVSRGKESNKTMRRFWWCCRNVNNLFLSAHCSFPHVLTGEWRESNCEHVIQTSQQLLFACSELMRNWFFLSREMEHKMSLGRKFNEIFLPPFTFISLNGMLGATMSCRVPKRMSTSPPDAQMDRRK